MANFFAKYAPKSEGESPVGKNPDNFFAKYAPDKEGGAESDVSTLGTYGETIGRAIKGVPAAAAQIYEGATPYSETNLADTLQEEQAKKQAAFEAEPGAKAEVLGGLASAEEVRQQAPSMSTSLTSLAPSIAGGAIGGLLSPVPGGALIGAGLGGIGSYYATKRAEENAFVKDYVEKEDSKRKADNLAPLTQGEKIALQDKIVESGIVGKMGHAGAAPEMIGTAVEAAIAATPVGKIAKFLPKGIVSGVSKISPKGAVAKGVATGLGKTGAIGATEVGTEAVTRQLQQPLQVEAGLEEGPERSLLSPSDWATSTGEVAKPTLLGVLPMAGIGGGYGGYRAYKDVKAGETSPQEELTAEEKAVAEAEDLKNEEPEGLTTEEPEDLTDLGSAELGIPATQEPVTAETIDVADPKLNAFLDVYQATLDSGGIPTGVSNALRKYAQETGVYDSADTPIAMFEKLKASVRPPDPEAERTAARESVKADISSKIPENPGVLGKTTLSGLDELQPVKDAGDAAYASTIETQKVSPTEPKVDIPAWMLRDAAEFEAGNQVEERDFDEDLVPREEIKPTIVEAEDALKKPETGTLYGDGGARSETGQEGGDTAIGGEGIQPIRQRIGDLEQVPPETPTQQPEITNGESADATTETRPPEERQEITGATPQAVEMPIDDAIAREHPTSDKNDYKPSADPSESKKTFTNFQDLPIAIENQAGSIREAKDKSWRTKMKDHYGEIKAGAGADEEAVDMFVPEGLSREQIDSADRAFIVDQINPETGAFDEHKVMLGYPDKGAAITAYKRNYSSDWKGLGAVTELPMADFKSWLKDPAARKKPVSKMPEAGETGKKERLGSLREQYSAIRKEAVDYNASTNGRAVKNKGRNNIYETNKGYVGVRTYRAPSLENSESAHHRELLRRANEIKTEISKLQETIPKKKINRKPKLSIKKLVSKPDVAAVKGGNVDVRKVTNIPVPILDTLGWKSVYYKPGVPQEVYAEIDGEKPFKHASNAFEHLFDGDANGVIDLINARLMEAPQTPTQEIPPSGRRTAITPRTGSVKDKVQRLANRRTADRKEARDLKVKFKTNMVTGAPNKQVFLEQPISPFIASIDIDSLKYVNDNLGDGHVSGDKLLRAVAQVLSKHVDVYHVSGDELLARGDSLEGLKEGLEAARTELASGQHTITSPTGAFSKPSFSYGIAETRPGAKLSKPEILEEALIRADRVMGMDKVVREKTGERAGRGERPDGFVGGVEFSSKKDAVPDENFFSTEEEVVEHLVELFGDGIKRLLDNKTLNLTKGKDGWPKEAQSASLAEAVYDNRIKKAFIDIQTTPKDRTVAVVLHEIGEHFNLRRMLGAKDYKALQNQIANQAKILGSLANEVWESVRTNPGYAHLKEGGESFIAEVIAKLGETAPNAPWYRRLLARVKAFLIENGLGRGFVLGTFTGQDVHDLLLVSLRSAANADISEIRDNTGKVAYSRRVYEKGAAPLLSKQISATQDAGLFDKKNPDIRFSITAKQGSPEWRQWFGASKMNRGGEPIKFYHGSQNEFTVYDKNRLATNTKHSTAGLGHFFTENKGEASGYGGKLHEVYLSVKNPYITNSWQLDDKFEDAEGAAKFRENLHAQGFDGIYIKDAKYAVAFGSNQVKLTTNERPTSSEDIRFSIPSTLEVDGVERSTTNADGGNIHPTRTGIENFWKWFGESKTVDGDGDPLVLYHGTTADFTEFNRKYSTIESDLGAGFYFTNTQVDVGSNYAGLGPDLTAKVERLAEDIQANSENGGEELSYEDALAEAKERYMKHEGITLPVYVALKNPVILDGKRSTFLDYSEEYDEETEEYGEPTGSLVDFFDGLRDAASDFDVANIDTAISDVMESAYDGGIRADELISRLKESEELMYAEDPNGNGGLASSEIIRRAFESIGFDGFIDYTVDEKFGSQKRLGKPMADMNPDTVHYVAFKPDQIKSALGNTGDFSASESDIMFSIPTPKFYSALEKMVENAPKRVFKDSEIPYSALQIKTWLVANAPSFGVKKDEIYWSGVTDWLDSLGKSKVSLNEVSGFLRKNGVKVEDVLLGDPNAIDPEFERLQSRVDEIQSELDDLYEPSEDGYWVEPEDEDAEGYFDDEPYLEDYRDFEKNRNALEHDLTQAERDLENYESIYETKHDTDRLTLPGGREYRELVVTIPTIEPYLPGDETHFGDVSGGRHIGWIRYNSREDALGKPILFLEELQSQRSQGGRTHGFGVGKTTRWFVAYKGGATIGTSYSSKAEAEEDIASLFPGRDDIEIRQFEGLRNPGVPPAPFVSTASNATTDAYVSLLLKNAISAAVANGQTAVSWTTGEQQADRYDLSHDIREIGYSSYKPDAEITRVIHLYPVETSSVEKLVIHIGKDGRVMEGAFDDSLVGKTLEDIIGKEPANAINSDPDKGTIEGESLKVGGTWAQSMYGDENGLNAQGNLALIPKAAAELARKMGGRVGKIKLMGTSYRFMGGNLKISSDGALYWVDSIFEGEIERKSPKFNDYKGASDYRSDMIDGASTQSALIITDEMRDKLSDEGMPLFSIPTPAAAKAAKTPKAPSNEFSEALSKMSDLVAKEKLGLLSVRQLVEVSKKYLPGLKAYVEHMQLRRAKVDPFLHKANQITDKWKSLEQADREAVGRVMQQSTLQDINASMDWVGIQPTTRGQFKAYSQTDFNALGVEAIAKAAESAGAVSSGKNYATFTTEEAAQAFLPTLATIDANQTERRKKNNWKDPNIARKAAYGKIKPEYGVLPEKGKEIYSETYALHTEIFDQRLQALEDRINESIIDGQTAKSLIAQLRLKFESGSLNWYYAPLKRFGDYWFYGKDVNGDNWFLTYESTDAREKAMKNFLAAKGTIRNQGVSLKEGQQDAIGDIGSDNFIRRIQDVVSAAKLPVDASKELQDEIYQLYLSTLPDVSIRHNSMHRKGTKGFTEDAMRAFANTIHHGASQLANMTEGRKMDEVLLDTENAIKISSNVPLKRETEYGIKAAKLLLGDWPKWRGDGVLESELKTAQETGAQDDVYLYEATISLRNKFQHLDTKNKVPIFLKAAQDAYEGAETTREKAEAGANLAVANRIAEDWGTVGTEAGMDELIENKAQKGTPEEARLYKKVKLAWDELLESGDPKEPLINTVHKNEDLLDAASKITDENRTKAVYAVGELRKAYKAMVDTNSTAMDQVAAYIRQFDFVMTMGFGLSSGLVNLFQTPVVAMPVTAGKYGVNAVRKAFGNTRNEFLKSVSRMYRKDSQGNYLYRDEDGNASISQIMIENLDYLKKHGGGKDEIQHLAERLLALNSFKEEGDVSRTNFFDIIGIGKEGESYGGKLQEFNKKMGWMFHHGERMNREISLMAAYDLARNEKTEEHPVGMLHDEAMDYARWVNNTAHGDYSAENAARIFRGPMAGVALQYKKYPQAMFYLWGMATKGAFTQWKKMPEGTMEEKAVKESAKREAQESARMLSALFVMQGAVAGLFGMPLMGIVTSVLNAIGTWVSDDDEPWDIERETRAGAKKIGEAIGGDAFGETLATGLTKGLGNALTPVNIASRMNLSNVFFQAPLKEKEGRDEVSEYLSQVAGPFGGMLKKIFGDGLGYLSEGEIMKAVESATPKAIGDVLKAARIAKDDYRSRNDDFLKDATATETLFQLIGLGSSNMETLYTERGYVKEAEAAIQEAHQKTVNKIARTMLEGEPIPTDIILEWNRKHPGWPIGRDSIFKSMRGILQGGTARGERGYSVNPRLEYLYDKYSISDEADA